MPMKQLFSFRVGCWPAALLLILGALGLGSSAWAKECLVNYVGSRVPAAPEGPLIRLMREERYRARLQGKRGTSRLDEVAPNEQQALEYLVSTAQLTSGDCGAVLFAAAFGFPKVLNQLIDRKVDLYAARTQSVEWTPLVAAAAEGQLETVKVLIQRKVARIDETTSTRVSIYGLAGRETALHWAARHGHAQVALYLVLNGASINAKTMEGETALDLAKWRSRDPETVKILEEHGAK